jgi:hypothetical protein
MKNELLTSGTARQIGGAESIGKPEILSERGGYASQNVADIGILTSAWQRVPSKIT